MKAKTAKDTIAASASLQGFYLRVLAYMFIAALVMTGAYTGFISYNLLWLVPYSLLYPHISNLITEKFKGLYPRLTHGSQLALDALHAGVVFALIGFAIRPILMGLMIIGFSTLIVGGPRLMLAMLAATLSITGVAWLILQPAIALEAPLSVCVTSVFLASIYICTTAYFVHLQGLQLVKARLEIKREQEKTARLAQNLAKYLSPQVWQSIFSGKRTVKLETQRKKLTVFFSDIKGFTELSEELEAEALTDVLNTYLNEMSKIALKYGGTIDKFIGDSVMVFFGDTNTQGAKKDAVAAVSMAIAMRKHMKLLRRHWRAQGIDKPLEIRMGINT